MVLLLMMKKILSIKDLYDSFTNLIGFPIPLLLEELTQGSYTQLRIEICAISICETISNH